jgi:pimeloyl-ACP methyl ester carboxylesterase
MVRRLIRGLSWLMLFLVASLVCILTTCRYQADRRERIPAAQAAPAKGQLIDAGDTRIFVQQLGPTEGPPVLFVHGTGAWSELWHPTLMRTAAAGFRVIAIDLPPFGFSEHAPQLSYAKTAQGMRIVKVLETLGIDRVVLVGHSFGAGPTVEAALLHPDRVTRLIIVDGALSIQAPDTSLDHSTISSRLTHSILHTPTLRDAVVATVVTNPRFTRRLLQGLIADPSNATDEVVQVLQQPMRVAGATAAVGRWLPELIDAHTISPSQTPASYSKLAMPVTLLWGSLDSVTPMEQAQRLLQLMPHAELKVLANVGHIPHVENPTLFNDALIGSLALDAKLAGPPASPQK